MELGETTPFQSSEPCVLPGEIGTDLSVPILAPLIRVRVYQNICVCLAAHHCMLVIL